MTLSTSAEVEAGDLGQDFVVQPIAEDFGLIAKANFLVFD